MGFLRAADRRRGCPLRRQREAAPVGQAILIDRAGAIKQPGVAGPSRRQSVRTGSGTRRRTPLSRRQGTRTISPPSCQTPSSRACGCGLPWFMCRSCSPRPGVKWKYWSFWCSGPHGLPNANTSAPSVYIARSITSLSRSSSSLGSPCAFAATARIAERVEQLAAHVVETSAFDRCAMAASGRRGRRRSHRGSDGGNRSRCRTAGRSCRPSAH